MVRSWAKVYRDGHLHRVDASTLVPGDIIDLVSGDRVPADARLLSAQNFATQEAALTGESEPQGKIATQLEDKEVSVVDQDNMVFMGTVAVRGKGLAVVTATGIRTELGAIASQLKETKRPKTQFQKAVARLSSQVLLTSIGLSALIFIVGYARNHEPLEMFIFTLAALVSIIPEGLPAVLSVVLAIGVYRMSRRAAIVRHLPAAETMGSVSVICTDKTGTLTRGEMMVQHLITRSGVVEVSGEGFSPKGQFSQDGVRITPNDNPDVVQLLRLGALAPDAEIEKIGRAYSVIGDPTEGALIIVAEKAGLRRQEILDLAGEVISYPFDSRTRYGATFVPAGADMPGGIVYAAGAPEDLLRMSVAVYEGGVRRPMSSQDRRYFETMYTEYSSRGLRVIAGAYRMLDTTPAGVDGAVQQLTFAGLFAMIDPPRRGVKTAIAEARSSGARVLMVTGDHAQTAWEIARQVGILRGEGSEVLLGEEVERMGEEQLRARLYDIDVIARVTPTAKLRIVRALQAEGEVVAMTGDGVNDAPALEAADIGIAMGITGTDVAKESAQMILTDDNFSSIVRAMEEGRVILRNIRQTTGYLLTTNIGEGLIVLIALMLNLPLPLLPVQILFLNLVTDGTSDVALATEGNHHDTMRGGKPDKRSSILTKEMVPFLLCIAAFMTVGSLAVFVHYLPEGLEKARAMAFVTMAFFQLWNVLNMRSFTASLFALGIFSNPAVIASLILSVLLQAAMVYSEVGQRLFSVVPLTAMEWGIAISVSSSVFIAIEAWKFARRHARANLAV
jgi:Ca2+-transporting ATPase